MNEGVRMKRECDERLRSLVRPGERVLANGTAIELRGLGDKGSGEWRFLLVTGERLLSAHWGHPERPHEDIAFDPVSEWADGTQYHRYLIVVGHTPLTRAEAVPAGCLALFGRPAFRDVTRTSTVLRFSRRDTAAATALRAVLSDRGLPHAELTLRELTRAERTRGSRVALELRR